MKMYKLIVVLFVSSFLFTNCNVSKNATKKPAQIAFIADVHLQDIFGTFSDTDFKGILNPATGEHVIIRTMASQLHSTRLFNENYFAFIATLEDVVARNIKCVVLPGDFSDDGQPIHVRGLRKILDQYTAAHGITFLVTTGNHDAVKPFAQDAIKNDYLGQEGQEQIITSSKTLVKKRQTALEPIISKDIQNWGYEGTINEMAQYGFFPQSSYKFWQSPFSSYSYETYNFEVATNESSLLDRWYTIPNTELKLPDASYVVEVIPGIWLLALDANIYVPTNNNTTEHKNPANFSQANLGYNSMFKYKPQLVTWAAKIATEAKRLNKTLITFSHYPMVDFNDAASSEMIAFFGLSKMQLKRVPQTEIAEAFANAGIKIHFGGHMHINDTGIFKSELTKNTLYNIQSPSLAAYLPAYKIATIKDVSNIEVETIIVNNFKNFNSLFTLYEKELEQITANNTGSNWNPSILQATDYIDFTKFHLQELVRLRYIPEDFPKEFLEKYQFKTGQEVVEMNSNKLDVTKFKAKEKELWNLMPNWNFLQMVNDFYKLKSADELAHKYIGSSQLAQYELICKLLKNANDPMMKLWLEIFYKTQHSSPSDHFKINLKLNKINRIRS